MDSFSESESGIFSIRSKSSMNWNQKLFHLKICDSIKRVMEIREGGLVRKSFKLSVSVQKPAEEEDILLVRPQSSYLKLIDSMAHQEYIILLSPTPAIKILIPLDNIELQKKLISYQKN